MINSLRTCWARILDLNSAARRWSVRHWRFETVLASSVVSIANAQEPFDLVCVDAAVSDASAIAVRSER